MKDACVSAAIVLARPLSKTGAAVIGTAPEASAVIGDYILYPDS
jgi:hypothetical protein